MPEYATKPNRSPLHPSRRHQRHRKCDSQSNHPPTHTRTHVAQAGTRTHVFCWSLLKRKVAEQVSPPCWADKVPLRWPYTPNGIGRTNTVAPPGATRAPQAGRHLHRLAAHSINANAATVLIAGHHLGRFKPRRRRRPVGTGPVLGGPRRCGLVQLLQAASHRHVCHQQAAIGGILARGIEENLQGVPAADSQTPHAGVRPAAASPLGPEPHQT